MSLFQRSLIALLVLCLGCSAQSNNPTEVERRIERQIRAQYQIPAQVDVHVGQRKPSEVPNYDQVTVSMSMGERKQDLEFLVSKDNTTLVRWNKIDLTKDPYAEVMKKIDVNGRPFKGNKDAKVVIVNYDDFQCPFCSRMHQTLMNDVYKGYADRVKIVYKDFPLYQIHPWANRAAIDANCLAAQNNDAYWAFADYVHANGREISGDQNARKSMPEQFEALDRTARDQGQKYNVNADKLNACLKTQDDSAVRASAQEAEGLGVSATPTMFINGIKLDGALPPEEVKSAINRALRDAGQPVPGAASASK